MRAGPHLGRVSLSYSDPGREGRTGQRAKVVYRFNKLRLRTISSAAST